MTKQEIIDNQRLEIQALRRNIFDYKQRHDKAVYGLSQLCIGCCRKANDQEQWHSGMQRLAADYLSEIAKMPLREAP